MKIVIFGDSLVGDSPTRPGALPRALAPVLVGAFPKAKVEAVGVGGSSADNWLTTAGLATSPGRWRSGPRALSEKDRAFASLPGLKARKADVYLISLGSNDAAKKVSEAQFARQARDLVGALPSGARIIWLGANRVTQRPGLERHKARLFEVLKAEFSGNRVLVLTPGKGLYKSGKLHPTVQEHTAFLRSVEAQMVSHIKKGIHLGAARTLGTVTLIGGAGLLGLYMASSYDDESD